MANGEGRAPRTDIQGLRAIAVGMVVVYHLHSPLLPGGFVGVDVFFVISGFLITAHLVSRPPRRPRDLADFWGRRIRRLLPASLLVLACTIAAVWLVAPETEWQANARDAQLAALYVLNWGLAGSAVDYLAADNLPTAVQHFWSLSVEEQFYFVWPILVALAVLAGRRSARATTIALATTLGAVVLASFAFSVERTASNPAAAYFITPTRMWELGIGGLVALLVSRRELPVADLRVRAVGAWAGLAMMVATGFLYSESTPFPGYQAALPVLGTALVILCRPDVDVPLGAGRLLALPPVRWVGDVSYSVYLWHWPLIVLAPSVLGHEPGWRSLLAIAAATFVLAGLTERFVERPFRKPDLVRFRRTTYASAVAGMSVVVLMGSTVVGLVSGAEDEDRDRLAAALRTGGPCFGAAALDPGQDCAPVAYDDLVPAPALAAKDKSEAYKDVGGRQCWSFTPTFEDRHCTFGDEDGDVTIALVGNSHAGHWLPALQRIAEQRGWRIETYLASQCAFSTTPQLFRTEAFSQACLDWVERTTDALVADQPDLVVTSNRVSVRAVGQPDLASSLPLYAEGFRSVFSTLVEADLPVLVIRDTPATGKQTPTCIADAEDDYASCDGTVDDWLPADPAVDVVAEMDDTRLRIVDLTDRICDGGTCSVVNGGVITYFDASHLTATYAYTLGPYLAPAVEAMTPDRPSQEG
ncbi:peptidoglycan/LPS O-acetylase OafA/YrhL [Nocardioides sp. J9]|uniref:acyltransferase family protein n=1 Tax=unclassified Nocardioides TaxID=2615069 RepID=UPI0011A731DA|nr:MULTISPECIES: acyltransferase family protein [unclassified Nocardioides]TWG90616.1 peptidoglycan/LPS O-acetylase OafA/YrhL [Nocardioides sp. J9]